MDKNVKVIAWVVAVLVVGWLGYSVMKGGGMAGTVKIGVIAPLSGDAAAYGQDLQKVLNHRLKEINEESDTKFEFDYEDGKCTGSDAVNAFQKLTDVDGVKIIIGGVCSSETLGIAPLTKDGKALAVSGLSSNPTIEGASPYVFSFSYSDELMGQTIAEQMKGFSKVAIISEQNDFNIGLKNVWEKKMAEYPNVKIVANETFAKGANDFRSIILKVQNAAPQAVFLNPNVGTTAQNLIKQLAEKKNWTGYKIYSHYGYLSDSSRVNVGNFADGAIIVDAPSMKNQKFLDYKDAIEKSEGKISAIGDYYTATALDDLDVVTSLVRELGNNQKAVRDAIAARTFQGYIGGITFGGHSFRQGSKAAVYVIQSGKAVPQ